MKMISYCCRFMYFIVNFFSNFNEFRRIMDNNIYDYVLKSATPKTQRFMPNFLNLIFEIYYFEAI